jgi:hypothetical protein
MKHTILNLAIPLLFYWNLNAQNYCIPNILHNTYERDVKHLALLRMEQFNAPALNLIDIDQAWQDTIWQGLAAIYYSQSEGRDAVFNQYCIHHNTCTSYDYLRVTNNMYVRLKPDATWYQNWVGGNMITNEGSIDSLLQKYGFESVSIPFPTLGIFRMTTNQFINLKPLADSLALFDGVLYAEPQPCNGGNNRITYQKVNGQVQFRFMTGWDDCLAGCLSWYSWSFLVDAFGGVIYMGASGSPGIPNPSNCNLFVDPPPSIAINGDLQICQGDSTILTASGGVNYAWVTGDSTATINVSPSVTTKYSVTVTSNDGCTDEKSAYVIVRPLPTVTLELPKDTFCINDINIALTGGLPTGGIFSGDGVNNGIFKPTNAGIGTHLVTYTFKNYFGCTNFNTQEVVVLAEGDCISATNTIAKASVQMMPNPSNGNFIILLNNWIEPSNIQLFDTQGRTIYSGKSISNEINIEGLSQGIYWLKVSNDKVAVTGKVIVL